MTLQRMMNRSESKYFNTALRMDDALVSLLEEKSLEYVTVKEICEKAGVNRSTFYLHYETIEDLLSECVENVNKKFLSYFGDRHKVFIEKIDAAPLEDLIFIKDEYLIPYLQFIDENRNVFNAAYNSPYAMQSTQKFERLYQYIFEPILDRFDYPEAERKYAIKYYIDGIAAVVREWLKGGCKESKEDIAGVIFRCIRPQMT